MIASSLLLDWREKYPSVRYVAPFATIILLLALGPNLPVPFLWEWPVRVLIAGAACLLCWPPELSFVPKSWMTSTAVGIAVFFLWIAPDLLFHGYRDTVLFSNGLVGHAHSTLPAAGQRNAWVLSWRAARAIIVVPIAEELFWRGWLMRWLIKADFRRVPLGAYAPLAFWATAILFAIEHGPFWDVGLLTGIIYNLWMIRTKSVADCILMHAVTNGVLSAYVVSSGQWHYWM